MTGQPVAVSPDTSVEELVENYIYRYHYKMLPVVHRDRLLGCVTTGQVREVPRAAWPRTRVGDLIQSCSADNSISPDADATQALAQMNRTGLSRLVVRDGDRLAGVISLKDLLAFLAFKMELEGDGRGVPEFREWEGGDAVEPEAWSVAGKTGETEYTARKAG